MLLPYGDEELKPFFEQTALGFTFDESARRAGMDWDRVQRSLDDIEVRSHALYLNTKFHAGRRSNASNANDKDKR
jgi:hypothetical protein